MKHRTWPPRSDGSPLSALPLAKICGSSKPFELSRKHSSKSKSHQRSAATDHRDELRFLQNRPSPSSSDEARDFAALPHDVLRKISASFSHPNLNAASLVCRSWNDALRPLREAMLFLRWGKRFKHGRGGVRQNLQKALDSFLKGASRGLTLAMVDAGLVYWEMGKRDEGIAFYRRAADLGDPAGQCNLGIAYLQVEPANLEEALRWLSLAASAGHARAQYQFALCLHQGRGINRNVSEAAQWYLKAAEGGYVRAMYNVSLCYSVGEGFPFSHQQAKKWMKRAADHGHGRAQFEHGLGLFSEGEMMKAVVYLELASRAGEAGASPVKNVILQQLSAASRDRAMFLADNWRALSSMR